MDDIQAHRIKAEVLNILEKKPIEVKPITYQKPYPGFLIVFEGMDGSGKTTAAKKLLELFDTCKIKSTYVRTPGGTQLSEMLRDILLNSDALICDLAEAMMFQAQLAQCIDEVILPKLKLGEVVVCDRLVYSTLAYQGVGRGMDLEWLTTLQDVSLQDILPDVCFMLNNPVKKELNSDERMEGAGEDFIHRVNCFYENVVECWPVKSWTKRITVDPDPSETLNSIVFELLPHMDEISRSLIKDKTND